jgi:hypothetical protein
VKNDMVTSSERSLDRHVVIEVCEENQVRGRVAEMIPRRTTPNDHRPIGLLFPGNCDEERHRFRARRSVHGDELWSCVSESLPNIGHALVAAGEDGLDGDGWF